MTLFALSGFLGLPSDWDFFPIDHIHPVDWQQFLSNSMVEWGAEFNQWALSRQNQLNFLMGYSLGGRLALHALIANPQLWKAAIIVSAHPGLKHPSEKEMRINNDEIWSHRFLTEDWETLMAGWNGQAVFANANFSFDRKEPGYSRKCLSQAILNYSLGIQDDLSIKIKSLPMPILWMTGSLDTRYCTEGEKLQFSHPLSKFIKIEGSGHRAPWQKQQDFIQCVKNFVKGVYEWRS